MRLRLSSYTEARGFSPELLAEASGQSLVLVFASPCYAGSPVLAQLTEAFPGAHLLGCSTAGEILDHYGADASISVAVVEFERTKLQTAMAYVTSAPESSYEAGRSIGEALRTPDLRGILVLGAGKELHGSELARGLGESIPPGVVVGGGLAGDGERFGSSWLVTPKGEQTGCARAIALYGEAIRIGHGSQGGWHAFGPERTVTRAEGNVLYELDGRPALRLYKEYLGERAAGLPRTARLLPLAVRRARSAAPSVLTIRGVDESTQAVIFTGEVPEGATAQLVRATFDRLMKGAADAATMVARPSAGPVLSLAVSCVGRRFLLRKRADEELDAVLEMLPPGARQVGFYSYGELALDAYGLCELRSQTMSITTLSEA